MEKRPYIEENLNNNAFVRTFSKNVLAEELVWHRDEKSRFITVLEGEGWEFQYENSLPSELKIGDRLFIAEKTYHRIKRGKTDLKLKIEEL
jgi:quercetin dioxygenase-like cupin family protein